MVITITEARKEHIPQLKQIWKICFGDSDEYIEFFFQKRFNTCKCIVAEEESRAIATVYLLPVSTYEYGEKKNGFYGYAIGVLPQYRGNGIYAHIDSLIEQYIKKHNIFYILCPANEKLTIYYKSLGFTENAFVSEKWLTCTNKKEAYTISPLTPEKCMDMRNDFFENIIYWDKAAIEYVLGENIFVGGKNIEITSGNDNHFLVIKNTENGLRVTESNVPKERLQNVTDFLCSEFSVDKVSWILPKSPNDANILYGLSKNLAKDNYYLNYILD